MRITPHPGTRALLAFLMALAAMALPVAGQTVPEPVQYAMPQTMQAPFAVEQLRSFTAADIKFDLRDLMEILRNRGHEGWVLAAYPDPKTGRPLIGAGFSLDLPSREHPQSDPLNPHPFIEPSSADLWQAAGLDAAKLPAIRSQFDSRIAAWGTKRFRKKIKSLTPQITSEEATRLLRVSAIQAVYNAKGYCRDFDRWTPSQQMALAQLVYQMGVNLQEFSQFLDLANRGSSDASTAPPLLSASASASEAEHWQTVQQALVQSQWARLYRARAVSVIAMLDPQYTDEPASALRRLSPLLPPVVVRRPRGRSRTSRQLASATGPSSTRRAGSAARRAKSPHSKRNT
jgi:GH24 family phage-related lysozyme (muramidase)